MTHIIEIQQSTIYVDTAIVEMTDDEYDEFKAITEPYLRQQFLSDLSMHSDWTTGDFVDSYDPSFYVLDGEAQSVWDELNEA